MTLAEFLFARIAEDEAWARREVKAVALLEAEHRHKVQTRYKWTRLYRYPHVKHKAWNSVSVDGVPTPERVLADCDAKRRIVNQAALDQTDPGVRITLDKVCELLALPYADHLDYQDEWTP